VVEQSGGGTKDRWYRVQVEQSGQVGQNAGETGSRRGRGQMRQERDGTHGRCERRQAGRGITFILENRYCIVEYDLTTG
jgi:hypothetical protein